MHNKFSVSQIGELELFSKSCMCVLSSRRKKENFSSTTSVVEFLSTLRITVFKFRLSFSTSVLNVKQSIGMINI